MKTEIFRCSECGAVEFTWRTRDLNETTPCGLVRKIAVRVREDLTMLEERVCDGRMEYYGYEDFTEFK